MRSTTLRARSSGATVSGSISGVCMSRPRAGGVALAASDASGGALVVVVIGLCVPSWLERSGLVADAIEQSLGHDEPMDLVRSLVDLRALRVAHEALDRIVA